MKFYVVDYREHPPSNASFPCVLLVKDSWDDFGYSTLFTFQYWHPGFTKNFTSSTKILDRNSKQTQLPDSFETLGDNFCSLGQTIEFYEQIAELDPDVAQDILSGLNDVVASPGYYNQNRHISGFEVSLLRFSEAEKALEEGARVLSRNSAFVPKEFMFTFSSKLDGASRAHKIGFDFRPTVLRRERIAALIGRNGTGKTQILANLANAVSGFRPEDGELHPARPLFSKVIAVSYSVFDSFHRPPGDQKAFSYVYCGLMVDGAVKGKRRIKKDMNEAWGQVVARGREEVWKRIMNTALSLDTLSSSKSIESFEQMDDIFEVSSSGQKILLLVLTQVVASIEFESLLLYDEPELHLHPDMLNSLAESLYLLLEEFESYAVVATHSPILLQEIPSRCVRVFRRVGSVPNVTQLSIESFGENLTVITNEVFGREVEDANYQAVMQRWAGELEMKRVVQEFNDKLGFNAMASLLAAYDTEGKAELE